MGHDQSLNRRWRDIDILTVLVLYALSLLILVYLRSFFFGAVAFDELEKNPIRFLFEELVDSCLLIFLPIVFVIKVYGAQLRDIGLYIVQPFRNVIAGAGIGLLLYGAAEILEWIFGIAFGIKIDHPYLEVLERTNSLVTRIALYVTIFVFGPLSEEIYFRGFVYSILKRNHGARLALIISATIFALVHFNVASLLVAWTVGIGLAMLFDRSGSLAAPIVAHVVFNVLSIFI